MAMAAVSARTIIFFILVFSFSFDLIQVSPGFFFSGSLFFVVSGIYTAGNDGIHAKTKTFSEKIKNFLRKQ